MFSIVVGFSSLPVCIHNAVFFDIVALSGDAFHHSVMADLFVNCGGLLRTVTSVCLEEYCFPTHACVI